MQKFLNFKETLKTTYLRKQGCLLGESFFLKRFDYIFSISDKELAYMKKYNKRIEFSPVPVLLDEFEKR